MHTFHVSRLVVRLSAICLAAALVSFGMRSAPVSAVPPPIPASIIRTNQDAPSLPASRAPASASTFTETASLSLNNTPGNFRTSIIDDANGFAYFGASYPAMIVKVRLSDFSIVSTLKLSLDIVNVSSSVIDTLNDFAYFATDGGDVIKIRLSDFSYVATLRLSSPSSNLYLAMIDSQGGYAYFGASFDDRLIRVRLSDFAEHGAIALGSGEPILWAGAIDSLNGYAYLGAGGYVTDTEEPGGKVFRVRLSDFSITNSLMLNAGEAHLDSAVIDTAGGYLYVSATSARVGRVVRIRLSDFTRVDNVVLSVPSYVLRGAFIDLANGYAYFVSALWESSGPPPGTLVKVRLSPFGESSVLLLQYEDTIDSAVYDAASGMAYLAANIHPGKIVQVHVSDMTHQGALTPQDFGGPIHFIALDTANGYGYFIDGDDPYGSFGITRTPDPGQIIKVRLSDMSQVAVFTLASDEGEISAATLDTLNGYGYIATSRYLIKLRLSDFTRVGRLTAFVDSAALSGVVDGVHGFAYFGTANSGIIQIRLADFSKVSTLPLDYASHNLTAAVIDEAAGMAYFASDWGYVTKVRLSDFTRVGSLQPGHELASAAIDRVRGYAYFGSVGGCTRGCDYSRIVRVRLTDYSLAGELQLAGLENDFHALTLDSIGGYLYVGTGSASNIPKIPGLIVRVRLSDFSRIGSISPQTYGEGFYAAAIDATSGYAYFGTNGWRGMVAKIDLAQLALTQSASQAAVQFGEALTYTLTAFNIGPIAADTVTLTDTLPAGLTFDFASAGCIPNNGMVVCTLPSLAAGGSTRVFIRANVTTPARRRVTNMVSVSGAGPRYAAQVSASIDTILNPSQSYLPNIGR